MRRAASAFGGALADLFYPRSCILTDEPLGHSRFRYLSDRAAARLPVIRDPRCPTCGHPFFGAIVEAPVCHHCELLHPVFQQGRCGFVFNRDCRALLHALKYQGKRHLAPDLAALLADAPGFAEFLQGALVVPVPLHPRKERRRGFNQSLEILRHLHRRVPGGIEIRPLLRRVIDTDSQTRADRKERMQRVRGAFGVDDRAELPAPETRCVLFDDVFTTGATLNACANALRRKGLRRIDAAAFAHG